MEYSTIFFRFFNLFILIAAIIYLFKTKFLGIIQGNIEKKLHYLKSLQQDRQGVIQQQENLDITIAQAHALMERLRSNVFQWNTAWQKKEEARKKRQINIETSIQKIIHKQQLNRANQKLQHIVVPKALSNARTQLETKFCQDEEQEKYLHALFDSLTQ